MMNTTHAIGWKAKDFALQGIDGRNYSLADIRGPKGTLMVFICNHCPYMKASINRIVMEANALREIGIGTIAIMPNDTDAYPQDSFDNMKAFAVGFPYVIDTTQEVALAYGAQCTPDIFGFNAQDELQYRGRLDASRMTPLPNARRDLIPPTLESNCPQGREAADSQSSSSDHRLSPRPALHKERRVRWQRGQTIPC
jgi:peroxiredoxin